MGEKTSLIINFSSLEHQLSSALAILRSALLPSFLFSFLVMALPGGIVQPAEALTVETVSVALNSPKADWRWGKFSIDIALENLESGDVIKSSPKDFPLTVPIGVYALTVEGIPLGKIKIEEDYSLSIPALGIPYIVYRDQDGKLVRGESMPLRSPKMLKRLMQGRRPLAPRENYGTKLIAIARKNPSESLVDEAITYARKRLPELASNYSTARKTADRSDNREIWRKLLLLSDIVSNFGNQDDINMILKVFFPPNDLSVAVETAVRLERRLGKLEGGAVEKAARSALKIDPGSRYTRRLIVSLARTGAGSGMDLLMQYRRANADRFKDDISSTGLYTLGFLPRNFVIEEFRAYLKTLAEMTVAGLSRQVDLPRYLRKRDTWRSAGIALALLSEDPSASDLGLMDLPIPPEANFDGLIPFVEHPDSLLKAYYREPASVETKRIFRWSYLLGRQVCAGLELRSGKTAERIVDKIRSELIELLSPGFTSDYRTWDDRHRREFQKSASFVLESSMSHCSWFDSVTAVVPNESVTDEEKRRFDSSITYDPKWWTRPVRAASMMKKIDEPKNFKLGGYSQYDFNWLMSQTKKQPVGDSEFRTIFAWHHQLLTDAYQSPDWHYGFYSERRIFKFRNKAGAGNIGFSGHVDVVPIIKGTKLIIAIRPNIPWRGKTGSFMPVMSPSQWEYYNQNNK